MTDSLFFGIIHAGVMNLPVLGWYALLCVLYGGLLAVYCRLEQRVQFKAAATVKVLLSAMASGCCVAAAVALNQAVLYIFALGMAFAVPADFFLQYIVSDLPKYRVGILCFGAMHVCLLVSFYALWTIAVYEFVIWAILVGILVLFQTREKWRMGREKRQLTVYTVLVTFMAAKALSLPIVEPSAVTIAAALGGGLFFVSDLFLGIWDYHDRKFVFLALNRVVYFAGQLSFAFYILLRLS